MLTESGSIIIMTGRCPDCDTHHARVHHRFYPETSGIGDTPREAAENLIHRLTAESGVRADRWHTEGVNQAIAELCAYVKQAADLVP